MITQKISKYKPQWPTYGPAPMQQQQRLQIPYVERLDPDKYDRPSYNEHSMSKLAYALYLRNLEIKVGDLVVSKYTAQPFSKYSIYRIESIDEIHRYVKFNAPHIGPDCLNLKGTNGNSSYFKAGANLYRKVLPEELPEGFVV